MQHPSICLTMIVRNEAKNIERCLRSVMPHIDAAAIVDTGSTDDTQKIISDVFALFPEKTLSLEEAPFETFSQARNASLELAGRIMIEQGNELHRYSIKPDWLLLLDADMTLDCDGNLHDVINKARRQHDYKPDAYHVMQTTPDGLIYPNIRIVHIGAGARYEGSTHEGLSLENRYAPIIDGVRVIDHETGSNRAEKYERDCRLLEEDLKKDPDNPRTIFYLAQSYAGRGHPGDIEKAAFIYRHRAGMEGTWEEERWLARLYEARQYLRLGRDGEFMFAAFDAWQMRPTRAEPLYDLAVYFRKKGMYEAARVMASKGLDLPKPKDMIFMEGNVYNWALREEYVLSASMSNDPLYRSRGAMVCNQLALDNSVSPETRLAARNNLLAYVEPLSVPCPSWQRYPIRFTPPEGYSCGLPSIIAVEDGFRMTQRAVNYDIVVQPDGTQTFPTRNGGPVHSRIFMLQLDNYFTIIGSKEILPPDDLKTHHYITGIEDMRLSRIGDDYFVTGMVATPEPEALCSQIFGRLKEGMVDYRLVDWRILPSPVRSDEKNWMQFVKDGKIGWIYNCHRSVVLDENANIVKTSTPPFNAEVMCGGSPLLDFDGGWLSAVHEHVTNSETNSRAYLHRFVWFNADLELQKCSPPFLLEHKGVEYVAGLAPKDDGRTLVMSYHVNDQTSWLATVSAADVRRFLG